MVSVVLPCVYLTASSDRRRNADEPHDNHMTAVLYSTIPWSPGHHGHYQVYHHSSSFTCIQADV